MNPLTNKRSVPRWRQYEGRQKCCQPVPHQASKLERMASRVAHGLSPTDRETVPLPVLNDPPELARQWTGVVSDRNPIIAQMLLWPAAQEVKP